MEWRWITLHKKLVTLQEEVNVTNSLQEAAKIHGYLLFWSLVWMSWRVPSRMQRISITFLLIVLGEDSQSGGAPQSSYSGNWGSCRGLESSLWRCGGSKVSAQRLSSSDYVGQTQSSWVNLGTNKEILPRCYNFFWDAGLVQVRSRGDSERWSQFLGSRIFGLIFFFFVLFYFFNASQAFVPWV